MKAEKESQQKKDSHQTKPESRETSEEGPLTSVLKVKSEKGRTVKIMQVEVDEPAEKKSHETSPEVRDESERKDKSTQQEKTETESDNPPIEFEDQMYERQDDDRIPGDDFRTGGRERAEYWEMREYFRQQVRQSKEWN